MNLAETVKNQVDKLMGVKSDTAIKSKSGKTEEILLETEPELEEEDVTTPEGTEEGESEGEETGEVGEEGGDALSEEKEGEKDKESENNLDELRKENDELRALLEDVLEPNKGKEKKGEEAKSEETQPTIEVKAQDYATSNDIDAIITGDTEGVKALNTLLNKVRQDTVNMVIEHVARSIPQIVSAEASRVVAAHTAVTEFYMEHTDLRPFKKFTGHVYEELSSNHPDQQLIDFLDGSKGAVEGGYDLATEVKKRLKLRGANAAQTGKKHLQSKQPGGTSGSAKRGIQSKPPTPKGVKSEVEDLKGRFGVR